MSAPSKQLLASVIDSSFVTNAERQITAATMRRSLKAISDSAIPSSPAPGDAPTRAQAKAILNMLGLSWLERIPRDTQGGSVPLAMGQDLVTVNFVPPFAAPPNAVTAMLKVGLGDPAITVSIDEIDAIHVRFSLSSATTSGDYSLYWTAGIHPEIMPDRAADILELGFVRLDATPVDVGTGVMVKRTGFTTVEVDGVSVDVTESWPNLNLAEGSFPGSVPQLTQRDGEIFAVHPPVATTVPVVAKTPPQCGFSVVPASTLDEITGGQWEKATPIFAFGRIGGPILFFSDAAGLQILRTPYLQAPVSVLIVPTAQIPDWDDTTAGEVLTEQMDTGSSAQDLGLSMGLECTRWKNEIWVKGEWRDPSGSPLGDMSEGNLPWDISDNNQETTHVIGDEVHKIWLDEREDPATGNKKPSIVWSCIPFADIVIWIDTVPYYPSYKYQNNAGYTLKMCRFLENPDEVIYYLYKTF